MAGACFRGPASVKAAGPGKVRVLAYGSNLLAACMRGRAPSAVVLSAARLPRHALRFHKIGRDGSGKADAFFTGRGDDVVWGVVYELSRQDKTALDLAEGLGRDYFEHRVSVIAGDGKPLVASLYTASPMMIDGRLEPFSWYKEMVVSGARQQGLPAEYVVSVESRPDRADGDAARVQEASRLLAVQ